MRSTTTRRNITAGLVGGTILALALPTMALSLIHI